ncbi:hypothetical protein AVEN_136182-1, partial [Araneus ventricosus]
PAGVFHKILKKETLGVIAFHRREEDAGQEPASQPGLMNRRTSCRTRWLTNSSLLETRGERPCGRP